MINDRLIICIRRRLLGIGESEPGDIFNSENKMFPRIVLFYRKKNLFLKWKMVYDRFQTFFFSNFCYRWSNDFSLLVLTAGVWAKWDKVVSGEATWSFPTGAFFLHFSSETEVEKKKKKSKEGEEVGRWRKREREREKWGNNLEIRRE